MNDKTQADPTFPLPTDDMLKLLRTGHYEIEGRMPDSSNVTLLVTVVAGDTSKPTVTVNDAAPDAKPISHRAIYKPGKGERPLFDFPSGLYHREVATFELAQALGWDVIPPTTLVEGPLGEGSAQAFVDANFEHHYFSLLEEGLGGPDLRRLCVLDFIANNADRKSGHCLQAKNGRVLGIDHGLTFHAQLKLRTVMWDYVDEPLGEEILGDLEILMDSNISEKLAGLLSRIEVDAMLTRAKALRNAGVFPADDTGGHRWPFPLI